MKRASWMIAVGAAAVLAAGVAYGAIPDGSGVIHACYHKSTSALRVIDSETTTCGSNETVLTWNQEGEPGPAGPPGPSGVSTVAKYTTQFGDVFVPGLVFTYQQRQVLANFVKAEAGTKIRLTWQSQIGTVAGECAWQIRVDGRKDTGSISPNEEANEGGTATASFLTSATIVVWFENLAAGAHQVQLWVRGGGGGNVCRTADIGNQVTYVEEVS